MPGRRGGRDRRQRFFDELFLEPDFRDDDFFEDDFLAPDFRPEDFFADDFFEEDFFEEDFFRCAPGWVSLHAGSRGTSYCATAAPQVCSFASWLWLRATHSAFSRPVGVGGAPSGFAACRRALAIAMAIT